jgi:hypothetical protein
MKALAIVSLATASLVLAAPQGKVGPGSNDDGWADWDTIVNSIEITGPEIMKAAAPGSKI